MVLRSIQSADADFPKIVSRLYLVSDILYNSFSVYSKAEPLRHAYSYRTRIISKSV